MGYCEHPAVGVDGPNVGDWYGAQCLNSACRAQGKGKGHPFEALKDLAGEIRAWERVEWDRYDPAKDGEKWISMEYEALRRGILTVLYGISEDRAATVRRIHERLMADRVAVSVRQVHDQLESLADNGDVTLSLGSADYEQRGAVLTSQGRKRVEERLPEQSSAPTYQHVGAIVHNMTGGNLQAAGQSSAPMSQIINDPSLLREQIEIMCGELLEAVSDHLDTTSNVKYAASVDELSNQLKSSTPDPSRIQQLIRTLSFLGDVDGTISIMAKAWPYLTQLLVLAAAQLGR